MARPRKAAPEEKADSGDRVLAKVIASGPAMWMEDGHHQHADPGTVVEMPKEEFERLAALGGVAKAGRGEKPSSEAPPAEISASAAVAAAAIVAESDTADAVESPR